MTSRREHIPGDIRAVHRGFGDDVRHPGLVLPADGQEPGRPGTVSTGTYTGWYLSMLEFNIVVAAATWV